MMYLFAFLLGCGIFWLAYEVGKTVGGSSSIEELEQLRARNDCLQRTVDFVNAELDHTRRLLSQEIASAHERIDPRDVPPYAAAAGMCFHGVSLSDHCGQCARQNLVAGGILN